MPSLKSVHLSPRELDLTPDRVEQGCSRVLGKDDMLLRGTGIVKDETLMQQCR